MVKPVLSVLRRVFDYLLGILVILAILKPFADGYPASIDLYLMAIVTTTVGAIGHFEKLWNNFKPEGNDRSGGI